MRASSAALVIAAALGARSTIEAADILSVSQAASYAPDTFVNQFSARALEVSTHATSSKIETLLVAGAGIRDSSEIECWFGNSSSQDGSPRLCVLMSRFFGPARGN